MLNTDNNLNLNQNSNGVNEKFLNPYNPQETEKKQYQLWEESGFFNPDNLPERHKKPFTIIMPPPNANGSLHAGHALFVTLEDLMIRYKRMQGFKTLWLPGADHAGFETQVVYEKKLEKEGKSRFKMDPKELYDEIMQFTLHNKSFMENQVRSLGASCDWSREKFTLEPEIVRTVNETFKKLSADGLLYRGKRLVNWCSKHQTSLSELETEGVEKEDKFYTFQYGPFQIGTTRPETKFGDKYVVMHPDDERYKEYEHKQKIDLEWINGPITATIIKDEAVDMEFGTGAMTITPWHDTADFEIAQRHNLEYEQIIDFYGKLLPIAGPEFEGKNITVAREEIVKKLDKKGLLVKVEENFNHNVKICYKCNRPIEPQIKAQWFIKTESLAQKALEAVEKGEVKFITKRHKKIFKHWLENIHDWNISRQIIWGIPIPAKICTKCGEGMVDLDNSISKCSKCGGEVKEDIDTFDTWFSSGQWPFATLDFPEGEDFKNFYPTDVMETGHDILFFWVARMVMLGIYRTGKSPFKDIYLHGLVRDAHGKKMSKSKGNVVNPLELSEKYGTDALRMSLLVGNTPGNDMNLSEDKIRAYKKFANKLWNVSRFVLDNTKDLGEIDLNDERLKSLSRSKIELQNLQKITSDITKDLDNFQFHIASEKIYHYIWHEFADKIIEEAKDKLDEIETQLMLLEILQTCLKTLHPFMPFITEEIWESMPIKNKKLLLIEEWSK
ncbi:MAG: valine--tRNA ligase [Candidatus Pacebacteria bacterium]|nr:valine--tRNA ligase [Candidatus Paceibacterota bacterium]